MDANVETGAPRPESLGLFMRLPRELRDHIYDCCLPKKFLLGSSTLIKFRKERAPLHILHVSKAIKDEVEAWMYGRSIFEYCLLSAFDGIPYQRFRDTICKEWKLARIMHVELKLEPIYNSSASFADLPMQTHNIGNILSLLQSYNTQRLSCTVTLAEVLPASLCAEKIFGQFKSHVESVEEYLARYETVSSIGRLCLADPAFRCVSHEDSQALLH